MLRFLMIGAVAITAFNSIQAQEIEITDSLTTTVVDTLQQDSVKLDNKVETGFFTENLDTLKVNAKAEASTTPLSYPKDLPDSVYIKRLQEMASPLEFPYNSKVRAYIQLYTQKKRKQVEIMLGLSDYYFPLFEEALDAANLPLELKYLPIIESALNPRAFSRAGASGLWQFMYGTGKMYGLQVDSYVDDRRDPIKATQAAVNFLKDLYETYGDWYLVIAAYNCGPGNVNKAIYRSGGKRDFWQIYYRLPRETRGYVPAFIAAAYTMTYHKEHMIEPKPADIVQATDTIMISDLLHFNQVSAVTGLPIETLRALNPQYRRDVVPAQKKPYSLKLPFEATEKFIAFKDSIFGYQREKYFASNRLVVSPSNNYNAPSAPKNKAKVYYTVKSGDAVGLIADWFDVYTSDLRYWNNIRRNLIKVGQKLVIYVPKDKASYYQKFNTMSYAQKQAANGKTISASTAPSSTPSTVSSSSVDANYEYYTVRRGDNLWSIAKRYPGISNNDIMRLNGLSASSKINPGQKLKIRPKS
ncbi:lytic transglycosylase domain-containing protein [Saccharicrinis fermentans]|uniref:Membrane-bound lytic murein transglycosylase D n=1 Tax=Saccharicrinis fermentans DSM 9555 = JCM 21142 TaxID=869213 RepID=W7YLI9_9BACT|nr:lytic transglycosylase domain-containing protein [Saccharicrinis fermentans]GAF05446.1 membrane-bound lytic murein transglycosylase D precursor [Saccharicrinis fermentans DSM 9555 = JCM 21142]